MSKSGSSGSNSTHGKSRSDSEQGSSAGSSAGSAAGRPGAHNPETASTAGGAGGFIRLFVRHRTAPNLLMAIMVMAGIFSILKLNRQFFPDFDVPVIVVSVAWPGASAEDTETNILDVLEPELRFLDGVSEVTSYAREGVATIALEFDNAADMQKAQSDVEQAVSRVSTLPEAAERPVITRAARFDRVARISLSGPFDEKVLKTYAKQLRDGLLASGIDRVQLEGARDEEIWIKLREGELRRLGLTLDEVSKRVRDNTADLPGGRLEGPAEIQLRAKSDRKSVAQIGAIEIKSTASGSKIFLRDIADIKTRFNRNGKIGLVRGERAIQLTVSRAVTADTLKTMKSMQDYVAQVRPTLPPSLKLNVYDVRGKLVKGRLFILLTNGLQGLAIVLIMLFIFLNVRVAFWVAMGIPIALLATLGVMWLTGQSINMVSMFGLIMMLGIIVDDAIVVGEHAATLEEQGHPRLYAAETGATHMFAPVSAAMLTTISAFLPIFFIGDRMGDIMRGIPLVVIAAIIASVIECFLVLPGHLRHGHQRQGQGKARGPSKPRRAFDRGFNRLRDTVFIPFVRLAYNWRFTTFAVLIATFIIAVGMMAGGRLKFVFFPTLEPENITASVVFAPGTPPENILRSVSRIEQALYVAQKRLLAKVNGKAGAEQNSDGIGDSITGSGQSADSAGYTAIEKPFVKATFVLIGKAGRASGDNLAQISVQLSPSEVRDIRTKTIIAAWRRAAPKIPGLERLAIGGRRGGPPGRDVDVRLQNAPVTVLKQAAEELKEALTGFPGVSAITDDLPYGKQELVMQLNPRGTALGLSGRSLGRQIRNAFEGAIATRFARGDDEITVRVIRSQEAAGAADLDNLYIATPSGQRVALSQIVDIKERRSFSIVQRRDGVRTVSVTGNIDDEVSTTEEVLTRLAKEVMPDLVAKYNIDYVFKGRNEERAHAFKDLKLGAMIALALIYIILAWVFGSYFKPLAVMAIIPFGFVGAVVGHYVMGYPITIISMIGLLGLSGILVNDSIVLVARVKERLEQGEDLADAAIGASRDRFRAVLLTSLTTIGGLLPLVFETSRQAQFLIPMALTIVFGLAAATILVLVLVPSLLGIGGDIRWALRGTVGRGWTFLYGSPAPQSAEPSSRPADGLAGGAVGAQSAAGSPLLSPAHLASRTPAE